MPKRNRQWYDGGVYHIIMRGHNRAFIYRELTDKAYFLEILRESCQLMSCKLLYYVLMDNHYHLILEMGNETLSVVLHHLNLTYAKYYNLKYHCTGSVYGGPFSSYLVGDTKYLQQLIIYIANNPVKARLVKQADGYRWCAHLELLSNHMDLTVSKRALYERLGGSFEAGEKIYHELFAGTIRPMTLEIGMETLEKVDCFHTKRREEQLFVELMSLAANDEVFKALCAGKRGAAMAKLRADCVAYANSKGYSASEIAIVLGVTRRRVNQLLG